MSSSERKALILKKMNAKGIKVGSGIPNKKYDSQEIYELIHIADFFPELRERKK
ncbi:MAG: 3-phosphoshikimate 1-carboxyvinyltransferase [Flavobacteriales bacterium]|nr:3-phosphoshikimate 1-carboxyvinyltransferase [Flavobacteriales bacterium]